MTVREIEEVIMTVHGKGEVIVTIDERRYVRTTAN